MFAPTDRQSGILFSIIHQLNRGETVAENNETVAKPKPVRQRQTGKRRSFAAELTDLQSRVDMAVRLLKQIKPGDDNNTASALTFVAIETLEGGL